MIQGKKSLICMLLVTVMAVTLALGTAAAQERKTLNFGVVAWSEALAEGELIKYIMEKEINQPVKITNPDIGVAYTAIANSDLDLFIEAWLPMTHEAYWDKIASKVCDFGPIYEDASLGWAVPNYVPKEVFNSVADMGKAEVKKKCDGKIIGIDPGSGLMQHSSLMMKKYPELKDWKLIEGSDYAMVASLKRAMQRKEWIVVTLWKPHFAFNRFDIRYIEDPRKILGTEERAHMIGRRDFMDVFPNEVSGFLSRLYFTIDQVNELVDLYEKDEDTAAEKFTKNHPKLVHYWVTGEVGN